MTPSAQDWFDDARAQRVSVQLVEWYDRHHRELPWRIPPRDLASGLRADPYRVWLSEIMLQQTTVEAVKPYFAKFVATWPTVSALAAADSDDIMKAWAGLGYYSRARNLKTCAETIENEYGGRFPGTEGGLLALPGIGPYTAAAIAAIAFDRPAAVVDGNVERVFTRLAAIATPLPKAKSEIKVLVAKAVNLNRPGDFAQATMDLGATICTPRRPKCLMCPVNDECLALREGDPEHYPVKPAKVAKPIRHGAAFVAVHGNSLFLRKRAAKGLLGGMAEVPSTNWSSRADGEIAATAAPFAGNWTKAGQIGHVFTHFQLELVVYRAEIAEKPDIANGWWAPLDLIHTEALPTVMKKAIEAAIPGATKKRSA
ncbi:A/G-specific adenine glycosylase [Aliihoeflea sp. PC F10.4]